MPHPAGFSDGFFETGLRPWDMAAGALLITEAGGLRSGTVKSAIGLGALLLDGIGDTIRISLAADPAEEAKVAWDMLRSLRLRSKGINFIACPSCSRQNFDVIKTVNELENRLEDITVPMDVSIIGCIVNVGSFVRFNKSGLFLWSNTFFNFRKVNSASASSTAKFKRIPSRKEIS